MFPDISVYKRGQVDQLSSTTTSQSGTLSSSQNRSLLSQIGLLAGGVLGGLVVVGVGILVWVLVARRSRKKRTLPTPDDDDADKMRTFHSGASGSDSSYEDTTTKVSPSSSRPTSPSSPTAIQLKPARLSSKHLSGLTAVSDHRSSAISTSSSVASSSSTIAAPTKSYIPVRRSPLASAVDVPNIRGSSPHDHPSSSAGSTMSPRSSKDGASITPTRSAPSPVELVPEEKEDAPLADVISVGGAV